MTFEPFTYMETQLRKLSINSDTKQEGTVAEWLECLSLVPKVLGAKHSLCSGFFKNYLFTQQYVNLFGYRALFRVEEGDGGEEEECRLTSVTPLVGTSWLFNSHFFGGSWGYGTIFTLPFPYLYLTKQHYFRNKRTTPHVTVFTLTDGSSRRQELFNQAHMCTICVLVHLPEGVCCIPAIRVGRRPSRRHVLIFIASMLSRRFFTHALP